jgi:hypothetical protein
MELPSPFSLLSLSALSSSSVGAFVLGVAELTSPVNELALRDESKVVPQRSM